MKKTLSSLSTIYQGILGLGSGAIPVIRLATAFHRERYSQALSLMEDIESGLAKREGSPDQLPLRYRAVKGELLIRNGRLDEAQTCLRQVLEEIEDEKSEKAEYVKNYLKFWLAELRGDVAQANQYSKAALKLNKHATAMIQVPIRDSLIKPAFFDPEIEKQANDAGVDVEEFFDKHIIKK